MQPGAPLIYTIHVANTGNVELHASITNTLPPQALAQDPTSWEVVIAPGAVWEHAITATVQPGYTGPLVSRLSVATTEGVAGEAAAIANGRVVLLPAVMR